MGFFGRNKNDDEDDYEEPDEDEEQEEERNIWQLEIYSGGDETTFYELTKEKAEEKLEELKIAIRDGDVSFEMEDTFVVPRNITSYRIALMEGEEDDDE